MGADGRRGEGWVVFFVWGAGGQREKKHQSRYNKKWPGERPGERPGEPPDAPESARRGYLKKKVSSMAPEKI